MDDKPRPLTQDERMRVEAVTKGESTGRHFDWTPEDIRRVMQTDAKTKKLTENDLEVAQRMLAEGAKRTKVARHFGVERKLIWRELRFVTKKKVGQNPVRAEALEELAANPKVRPKDLILHLQKKHFEFLVLGAVYMGNDTVNEIVEATGLPARKVRLVLQEAVATKVLTIRKRPLQWNKLGQENCGEEFVYGTK